jgi:uncharacterized cupredoxin-like copper-binding protein
MVATALTVAVAVPALPAAATDWSLAQPVSVTTAEYGFEPKDLSFKAGSVYKLHVENRGKEMHEFSAPEFFKAVRIRNPKALNPDRTEIALKPGQAQDLYFVAKTPGSYKLICPDHDWAGMTGAITIAP